MSKEAGMQVVQGELKLQYGLLRVYEMLEPNFLRAENFSNVAGYAIYDLNHRRVGRIYKFYGEVIADMERVAATFSNNEILLAA